MIMLTNIPRAPELSGCSKMLSSILPNKNKITSMPSRLRAWSSGMRCLHLALIAFCLLTGTAHAASDAAAPGKHPQNYRRHPLGSATCKFFPDYIKTLKGYTPLYDQGTWTQFAHKKWHLPISRATIDQWRATEEAAAYINNHKGDATESPAETNFFDGLEKEYGREIRGQKAVLDLLQEEAILKDPYVQANYTDDDMKEFTRDMNPSEAQSPKNPTDLSLLTHNLLAAGLGFVNAGFATFFKSEGGLKFLEDEFRNFIEEIDTGSDAEVEKGKKMLESMYEWKEGVKPVNMYRCHKCKDTGSKWAKYGRCPKDNCNGIWLDDIPDYLVKSCTNRHKFALLSKYGRLKDKEVLQYNSCRAEHADFFYGEGLLDQGRKYSPNDTPPNVMPFRLLLNLVRIIKKDADVICLQELDHYWDCYKPWLNRAGYECEFMIKHASNGQTYTGGLRDGIMIAWKKDKLQQTGTTDKTAHKKKGNAMYVILKEIKGVGEYAIITGHLKSGKEDCPKCNTDDNGKVTDETRCKKCTSDVGKKAAQAKTVSDYATKLFDNGNGYEVIICCDFNSDGGARVDGGTLTYNNFMEDCKPLGLTGTYLDTFKEHHPSGLKWRMSGAQSKKIERQILMEKQDFIFKTEGLQTVRALRLLNPHQLETIQPCGLPLLKCGSDHMMLMAEVRLKNRGSRRLMEEAIPTSSYLHSAEEVIARRRLVDHARIVAKDEDAMSPSELVMRRRRLAYGARVAPILAELMDEIEEAERNHA